MWRGLTLLLLLLTIVAPGCDQGKTVDTGTKPSASVLDVGEPSSATTKADVEDQAEDTAKVPKVAPDPLIQSLMDDEAIKSLLDPTPLQCKNACHKLASHFVQVTAKKYGDGLEQEVRKYLMDNIKPFKDNCQQRCLAEFSPWAVHCILTNSYFMDMVTCAQGELVLPMDAPDVSKELLSDKEPSEPAPASAPPTDEAPAPDAPATPTPTLPASPTPVE